MATELRTMYSSAMANRSRHGKLSIMVFDTISICISFVCFGTVLMRRLDAAGATSLAAAFEMYKSELPLLVAVCAACSVFLPPHSAAQPADASTSVVTGVSYVFEAFSPYSMIRFFEFSDKGWNISENCLRDMYAYLEGLRRGALWAVKLYDASGYYGGGVFYGASNVRIHNPDLCRTLLRQHEEQRRRRPWRLQLTNASALIPPFAVHIVAGHYLLEIADSGSSFKFEKIQQLICFPRSCTDADLREILDVYLFQSNHVVRNNTYLRHRIVTDAYNVLYDFNFVLLIVFIGGSILIYSVVHLLLHFVATLNARHSACQRHVASATEAIKVLVDCKATTGLMPGKSVNFLLEPSACPNADNLPKIVSKRRLHQLEQLLNAVSLPNVVYNLLQEDAAPQAGIYVLFTVLLIVAHLLAELGYMSSSADFPRDAHMSFVLKHASYMIDVYFFVCGTKLAYRFFQTLPSEKLNVCDQLTHILRLILQKIFSLLPSYTFSICAELVLDRHFHNNVALEFPTNDHENCVNKLSNILYMDTFFPLAKRCMPWTWFMSLEVQFFIIACLVLLLAVIHPHYATIIGAAIFIVSMTAASLWEWNSHNNTAHLATTATATATLAYDLSQFNLVFDNICLRIAPYLLGICLGCMLHRSNSSIALNVLVLICGWLACVLSVAFFFFGYDLILPRLNALLRACLVTLAHIMWSIVLMWTTLTSLTRHGDFLNKLLHFKYSAMLERLSPICLLIAPICIRLFIFTAEAPIYAAAGQFYLMAIGCLLTIYVAAALLYVLLDGPLSALIEVAVTDRGRI